MNSTDPPAPPPLDARRLVALLANPLTREIYARVVLGLADRVEIERNAKGRRAFAGLLGTGLVRVLDGGALDAPGAPLEALLQSLPRPVTRAGLERFVRDGRLDSYPAHPDARVEVLTWLASNVLAGDEIVDETTVTERLAGHVVDAVTLRRYLVDAGLLVRTRSGSSYTRGPGGPPS